MQESLSYQADKIDQYLGQLTQLVWQTGSTGDLIKNKIKHSLTAHLLRL